jgi:hypothetical protein
VAEAAGLAVNGSGPEKAEDTSPEGTEEAGVGAASDRHVFQGRFTCERAGRYGIAVRVVPSHPDLVVPADMGCVTWASLV